MAPPAWAKVRTATPTAAHPIDYRTAMGSFGRGHSKQAVDRLVASMASHAIGDAPCGRNVRSVRIYGSVDPSAVGAWSLWIELVHDEQVRPLARAEYLRLIARVARRQARHTFVGFLDYPCFLHDDLAS